MRFSLRSILLFSTTLFAAVFVLCCQALGQGTSATSQASLQSNTSAGVSGELTVPAGARIVLALVRPVASKTVSPGDTVYLQTTFPVLVGNRLAIPAGTFVQGALSASPNRMKHQIELPIQSVVLIFGSGHTVAISGAVTAVINRNEVNRNEDSSILDVGSPGEFVLSGPLVLEEQRVGEALHQSNRLLAVHDLVAVSRPAQNLAGTCYTPEIPPRRARHIPGRPPSAKLPGTPGTYIPPVTAKPGTPYPCP